MPNQISAFERWIHYWNRAQAVQSFLGLQSLLYSTRIFTLIHTDHGATRDVRTEGVPTCFRRRVAAHAKTSQPGSQDRGAVVVPLVRQDAIDAAVWRPASAYRLLAPTSVERIYAVSNNLWYKLKANWSGKWQQSKTSDTCQTDLSGALIPNTHALQFWHISQYFLRLVFSLSASTVHLSPQFSM